MIIDGRMGVRRLAGLNGESMTAAVDEGHALAARPGAPARSSMSGLAGVLPYAPFGRRRSRFRPGTSCGTRSW